MIVAIVQRTGYHLAEDPDREWLSVVMMQPRGLDPCGEGASKDLTELEL